MMMKSRVYIILPIIAVFVTLSCHSASNIKFIVEKYDTTRIKAKGALIDNKREGYWIFYHENGNIQVEQIFKSNKANGPAILYDKEGSIIGEGQYVNDTRIGNWRYYMSGKLIKKGAYENGKQTGIWEYYVEDGRLDKKVEYKKDKVKRVILDNHIGPPIEPSSR